MIKHLKKFAVGFLAASMLFTTVMPYLPSLEVLAAPIEKQMAQLTSGSGNGNGHFGSAKAEAFILSDQDNFKTEDFSFTMKLISEKADTRFRFVTKYIDDNNWAFIGYDGSTSNWYYQYKVNGEESYPGLNGLPVINKNDIVNISGSYSAEGLVINVENTTTKESKTITASAANKEALKAPGKIGFGAGAYGTQYTDICFSDVTVGDKMYQEDEYAAWTLYQPSAEGQKWNPSTAVIVGDDGQPDPDNPAEKGKKWITVEGGRSNGGGHAYSNANATAPALLLDADRTMPADGTLSLTFRPVNSNNFGIFYHYKDDNNWLYIGYDTSSGWYYQYKVDGAGSYPKLDGLPTPSNGTGMGIEISLSREQLAVSVDGKKTSVSAPNLQKLTDKLNGTGKFGVKTNGATKVEFSDLKVNGIDCMNDRWTWCAERSGQKTETYYTSLRKVSGKVLKENGEGIEGATVYFGASQTTTDAGGVYMFEALETGSYNISATAPGYQASEGTAEVTEDGDNTFDFQLKSKGQINLDDYDTIASDYMTVYIGKHFPYVARYILKDENGSIFRAQENALTEIEINGTAIKTECSDIQNDGTSQTYSLNLKDDASSLDLSMKVKLSVSDNDLTWEVAELHKNDGCAAIATINIPQLNLLSIDAVEKDGVFNGAKASNDTTKNGDRKITWDNGFTPSTSDGYLYAFLTNGNLCAGLWSNSEVEGDKRAILNCGADTMSLASAIWYYEKGDKGGQKRNFDYPVSELPCAKICIAGDINEDTKIDWNDGALAYRDIMNFPQGSENIKDLVNYRIVMNFASMASNPYLTTADNIKKVYLATDGLAQAVMLKGYGNEGHDSANSEYADIAEREGGVTDFQNLIKIAHDYGTEIGVHINAQEAYPESKSFNNTMVANGSSAGWGWLDQSYVIDKLWDLGSQARYKRLVQFYDRINGTDFYSGRWENGEYVKESAGTAASPEKVSADAAVRKDNMDFIYLDVWYQDAWETRKIANEINSLGWRFSTEFPYEGEYDSTWSHWATDAAYGGNTTKGYNSEIIRFIRNDQRDTQVINYPSFGGAADNPLLGGFRLYGFEGWGGDKDYNKYIRETFTENLPTKFLQHYYVTDWEDYGEGEVSPTQNKEKQITLKNDNKDTVVVTRKQEQRSDDYIERTITLNNKVVLDDVTYLLPWTDGETGEEKLYHWNLEGGTTTWQLQDHWANLANVVVYELSDQGRSEGTTIDVQGGALTLDAKAETAYVIVKGASAKTLKNDFGETDYVADPGFNGYTGNGDTLKSQYWSGALDNEAVVVEKASTGDQRLAFNSPKTDAAVTTQIKGLQTGADYVAEVYVANESDAKAAIEVNTGTNTVTNYTMRSILPNYVKSDQKNGTNMQRMQIPFVAEGETAQLTLSRAAGSGSTYMDDIRIVRQTVKNYDNDGNFVQDFESVVQGLYPFVLSSAQGISDPRTHLAQLNAPYTQAGWNNKATDDVISDDWSLKHHDRSTGVIYQTLPQNFRFEAGKVYTVEFDYQSGPDKAYAMVIGNGTSYNLPEEKDYLAQKRAGETGHVTMQVIGGGNGQTWIGLYENGSNATGNIATGEADFILDNLRITPDKDAAAIAIDDTELYLGETAQLYGSRLDQIKISSDNENIAVIDKENWKVNAVGAGTATITAELPNGTVKKFIINVTDQVIVDIADQLDMTATANTEEPDSAKYAVDGDPATRWHSSWSQASFVVSKENPAILTIDLGKEVSLDGFRFLQRNDGNINGKIYEYQYLVTSDPSSTDGISDPVVVPEKERETGAWSKCQFPTAKTGRYLVIHVTKGGGNFASVQEVVPFIVQKVADKITLTDTELQIGERRTLEVGHEDGTLLKGLVWSSSDNEVVTVEQNGTVNALKSGEAVITVSNAAGLKAECTVTVAKTKLDTDALKKAVENAKEINLEKYKDGTEKDNFISALADANSALENASSQTEVDNALNAFNNALQALLDMGEIENSHFVPDYAPTTPAPEAYSGQVPPNPNPASGATLAVPRDLKATEITSSSVALKWSKPKDDSMDIAGYEIYVNDVSIGTIDTNAIVVENLNADTVYTIAVSAYDKEKNHSQKAIVTLKTKKAKGASEGDIQKSSEQELVLRKLVVKPVQTGDHPTMIPMMITLIMTSLTSIYILARKKNSRI